MIFVRMPQEYLLERKYILDVVLLDFLGLEFQCIAEERQTWSLMDNDTAKELVVEDCFFQTPDINWLKNDSLPKQPLHIWWADELNLPINICSPQLPIIYGNSLTNKAFLQQAESQLYLGLDIFGSIFFMLTRYEEYVKSARDQFDRFPASASLAYQEGFLHRPIVNEYVEILWVCLKKLWPGLERKPRQFKILVSHDVDHPFQYKFTTLPKLTSNVAGDLIKRRNLKQGLTRIKVWSQIKRGALEADPFNTFNWIMDLSEFHNLTNAFYFITDHTDPKKDGNYSIYHASIRTLLRTIRQRGHEIGLHPSFSTYLDPLQTRKEFKRLRQICQQEKIYQENWGGRQHYLRWQAPDTFQNWNDAGLNYDSTLTFAEQAGFRCGTCYEYPVFNLTTCQTLKLTERPLIVMECSVLDDRYMGLNRDMERAYDYITNLKNICRLFNGNFTLLWHNNRFANQLERELYEQILIA